MGRVLPKKKKKRTLKEKLNFQENQRFKIFIIIDFAFEWQRSL